MKLLKPLLLLLLILPLGINAQTKDIVVVFKDGTEQRLDIESVVNLKFSILLTEIVKQNNSESIRSVNIQKIYFDDGIPDGLKTKKELDNILIYPNPTDGLLTFSNVPNNKQKFRILKLTGIPVYEGILTSPKYTIELGGLEKGIYFIEIDKKLTKIVRL